MAEQLARVGLAFTSPNVSLFSAVRPQESAGFESIGARGCFMSHLQILREAVGLRSVLILEDDLDFVPRVNHLLGPAEAALPPDWGIFYGGCVVDVQQTSGPLMEIEPSMKIGTTHFVAFSGDVIGRVVTYLEAILERPQGHIDGGPMHVDGAYSRFRADHPDVRTFVAMPELGYQRPSRTDIHELKWFDRAPLVRSAVESVRRVRAMYRRNS
jgi:hypothetical protein